MNAFPETFAVDALSGSRRGYALYRWTNGGLLEGQQVHSLRPLPHMSLYYTITNDETLPLNEYVIQTKKSHGNVIRPARWWYTRKVLEYTGNHGDRRYPVIKIQQATTVLPAYRTNTFIPIVQDGQQPNPTLQQNPALQQAQLQALHQLIDENPVLPVYSISTIPQHAVRAFLTHAALIEEQCSITGESIDIANGAITTCFHTFQKDAIARWLSMPNSQDKCPVCNTKCNMFTLDT